MNRSAPSAAWPSPVVGWSWVALLLAAYTSSFIDRQILSLMVDPISRDLGITDTQFSLLQGLAFAVFYTVLGVPIGALTDRFPRRAIISAGIVTWSVMTAFCGLANSFGRLFVARIGVGVGEAALSPAAYSILSDCFPRERLGRAISVYFMGTAAGAGLAMIFGGAVIRMATSGGPAAFPLVGVLQPWQQVFLWVSLPALPIAGCMWLLKEPARRQRAEAKAPPISGVFGFIGGRMDFFGPLILGLAILSAVGYAVLGWVPAYFMRVHGLSPLETGLQFGAVCLLSMSAGLFAGAWLTERLSRRFEDAPIRVSAIGVGLGAPIGILAPLAGHPTLALAGYALFLFFVYWPWGVASAAIQTVTPNEMRGRVSALYLFSTNIVGLTVGPLLTATLTDQVFRDKAQVGQSLAVAVALLAPLSALGLAFAVKPFRRALGLARPWLGEPAAATS